MVKQIWVIYSYIYIVASSTEKYAKHPQSRTACDPRSVTASELGQGHSMKASEQAGGDKGKAQPWTKNKVL